MNFTKYSKHFILFLLTLLVSITFWVGFYLNIPEKMGFPKTSLETVFANYDGPNYIIISKCWYDKKCIGPNYSLPQPLEYYPAHLPGYPMLIKYLSFFTTSPKAMLLATLVGSVFLTLITYYFFLEFLKPKNAFWLTIVSIFFPARMLIMRLVGAPEVWFIGLTLLSVILFRRNKFIFSAIFGALALLFKSPGILLFGAYFVVGLYRRNLLRYWPYLLIPLTGLGIFYFYYLTTGDFFAYFNSGDNIHLNPLPYLVFISNHTWINTIWLEDVIYIYLLAFYGLYRLFKKFQVDIVSIYPLIFTLAAVFVAHRDISRYISPVYPFLLLAFAKFINKKQIRLILLITLPAVILYAINFVIGNTAPISDWTHYL